MAKRCFIKSIAALSGSNFKTAAHKAVLAIIIKNKMYQAQLVWVAKSQALIVAKALKPAKRHQ